MCIKYGSYRSFYVYVCILFYVQSIVLACLSFLKIMFFLRYNFDFDDLIIFNDLINSKWQNDQPNIHSIFIIYILNAIKKIIHHINCKRNLLYLHKGIR